MWLLLPIPVGLVNRFCTKLVALWACMTHFTLMKSLLTFMMALLAGQALAQSFDLQTMSLARKAVMMNSPKEALLSGSSPLSSHPMFNQVVGRVDFNRVNEQAASLMVDVFSPEEIQALVDFLESPAGQRITMKMPGYQKLVGSMVQNEMKAAFEGYVLSQGANAARGGANGPAMQGTPRLSPNPMTGFPSR